MMCGLGNDTLDQLFCGNPVYAPGGYAIGTDYCINYWNRKGFTPPPAPAPPGLPVGYDPNTGIVADPNSVDETIAATAARQRQQYIDFFGGLDTTDAAIGGPPSKFGSATWWVIAAFAVGGFFLLKELK